MKFLIDKEKFLKHIAKSESIQLWWVKEALEAYTTPLEEDGYYKREVESQELMKESLEPTPEPEERHTTGYRCKSCNYWTPTRTNQPCVGCKPKSPKALPELLPPDHTASPELMHDIINEIISYLKEKED